jgi:hypothetical protein
VDLAEEKSAENKKEEKIYQTLTQRQINLPDIGDNKK